MVQPLQGDVVPLVHHDRGINGVDVLVDLVLMPPLVPGREEPAHERSRKTQKNGRIEGSEMSARARVEVELVALVSL